MTMIDRSPRRRVTSRCCAFSKCWCASTFIWIDTRVNEARAYHFQDDHGKKWIGGEDLIETHTEAAPLTRYERLTGVDT